MAPLKRFRTKRLLTFNAELDIVKEFEEICHNERKSITEKLNELIVHTVERAGIGENNPLGITYGPAVQRKITNFNTNNPVEIVDQFIQNGIIGIKDWQAAFAEVQDQPLMQRIANLTEVMRISAKARLSYLKTGIAPVTSGKVQQLPSMKGTRSGF